MFCSTYIIFNHKSSSFHNKMKLKVHKIPDNIHKYPFTRCSFFIITQRNRNQKTNANSNKRSSRSFFPILPWFHASMPELGDNLEHSLFLLVSTGEAGAAPLGSAQACVTGAREDPFQASYWSVFINPVLSLADTTHPRTLTSLLVSTVLQSLNFVSSMSDLESWPGTAVKLCLGCLDEQVSPHHHQHQHQLLSKCCAVVTRPNQCNSNSSS